MVVNNSSVFVDKTLLIEEIINSCIEVSLITMPRRWGKSMNMNVVKTFFEIEVDVNGNKVKDKFQTVRYKLFAGGSITIGQGPLQQTKIIRPSKLALKTPELLNYQGECPVVY